MSVIVRFPPSPTGFCHVGTARMAVLNFLFARKHSGVIILRSEDTDRERSKAEYEQDIQDQLTWLGLSWDSFYRTSEMVARHTAAMQTLIDGDKAYVSKEESKKEPGKNVEIVRLRNLGKKMAFTDVIRGEITFDTTELGDFAIGRAIDDPLYHLAVVVDDAADGITHVIRGEDHISNTPRQILIQEALGYPRPIYAHYPLHLGADKSKLSKRTGDVAVKSYREKGYLPEALLNYIAVLGWTPPSENEILSIDEMLEEFELKDLHKSGAIFDIEKLRWYNRQYLSRLSDDQFASIALGKLQHALEAKSLSWNESAARLLLPILRERISVWEDIDILVQEGEFELFFIEPELSKENIPNKKETPEEALEHLTAVRTILIEARTEVFDTAEGVKSVLWAYAEEKGRGNVLWPLRYALSGREKSPDPFVIASIIGKEKTLARIDTAIRALGETT